MTAATSDRDRQLVELRLRSPKRADAGKAPPAQHDAGHLPLFVAGNEPRLI